MPHTSGIGNLLSTLSDASMWSPELKEVLVAEAKMAMVFKEAVEAEYAQTDFDHQNFFVSPMAWIYGCGTVYGVKTSDREHLAQLCKMTGDDSVINAAAVDSYLGLKLSKEASKFMKSSNEFDRLASALIVRDYVHEWKNITNEDLVRVYFFDDMDMPILQKTQ